MAINKSIKNSIKSFIKWLGATRLLSIPRGYLGRILVYYYSSKGKVVYNYSSHQNKKNAKTLDLIRQIKEETEMLLADQEAFLIHTMVEKVEKIEGDIAEVGVYRGGSAKLMREATKKPLHLFDTFEGLPDKSTKDMDRFHKGDYSASLESVKSYLKNYPDISFYKGLFPETAKPVESKKFSLVHLDVDLYESTLNSLKFFYPRMSRGGVIISHDYRDIDAVKKAFDEFFEDKLEIIIEPYITGITGQCLIVKV